MIIGIDASRAAAVRRTGTENYSLHLIRELLAVGGAHRFRLYFNHPPSPDLFAPPPEFRWEAQRGSALPGTAGGDNAELRLIPCPRLWTHLRLSWEMLTRPPEVLFVPAHVLPLVHPRHSVVTIHDLGYHYYPRAHTLFQNLYLRWSTRHNARAATRVLADSEATRQDLIRCYNTPPDKVVVVYPGRNEALAPVSDPAILAAVRARYGIPGPYLLYVGTLHPRKNLGLLIAAFASNVYSPSSELRSLFSNLFLVLAGQKGWLHDDIFAQVERLNLADRILFPGYVPDTDLPALLSGALAFVYPSLHEGFGFPVLEAMACGTPVVCANSSSLPEVAGDAALLVDPRDGEEVAGALAQIVADEGLRYDLMDRGLRRVQRFSWRRCAEQVLAVLEEVGRGLD